MLDIRDKYGVGDRHGGCVTIHSVTHPTLSKTYGSALYSLKNLEHAGGQNAYPS
jgi:hypothetical protein